MVVAIVAVIGILYGAAVSYAQRDVKKLVAYSSVSHLGFIVLGTFALTSGSLQGAVIQNVDVNGGFVGLSFQSVSVIDPPTTGSVRESSFAGNFIGVLIANSTDATIEEDYLAVWMRDADTDPWLPTAHTHDLAAKWFNALVPHFSGYAVSW